MEKPKRLLVRDIMYCKPGKVRPLVEKLREMAAVSERLGAGRMRILTDLVAEQYWTAVIEIEVDSLEAYERMDQDPSAAEAMGEIMQGYHDLVERGRREIFTIEG
jgi:hypothetical protein